MSWNLWLPFQENSMSMSSSSTSDSCLNTYASPKHANQSASKPYWTFEASPAKNKGALFSAKQDGKLGVRPCCVGMSACEGFWSLIRQWLWCCLSRLDNRNSNSYTQLNTSLRSFPEKFSEVDIHISMQDGWKQQASHLDAEYPWRDVSKCEGVQGHI